MPGDDAERGNRLAVSDDPHGFVLLDAVFNTRPEPRGAHEPPGLLEEGIGTRAEPLLQQGVRLGGGVRFARRGQKSGTNCADVVELVPDEIV